jgi:hypothetical protein
MAPPIAATVTLSNLAQTYDGTPKSATATTSPGTYAVNLTYSGTSTAPTNVGSYTVVGTINDLYYSGSATGTLVIADSIARWRQQYFGSTSTSGTAADAANPDGDAFTNIQEYLFGTVPTTADNAPLMSVAPSGSNIVMSFVAKLATGNGYSGFTRHYAVESTNDLVAGTWTAVSGYSDVTGAGQTVNVTQPLSGTKCFYRLKAWLQ